MSKNDGKPLAGRATRRSRRQFIKDAAAATAAGLSLPLGLSCSSDEEGEPEPDAGPGPGADAAAGADSGAAAGPERAAVGLVRDADVLRMVRDAIELAGGLGEIKGGDTVVIKPNITAGLALGGVRIYTSPLVLQGVIQAVKAHTDAAHITLAECAAFGMDTAGHATGAGIVDVCEQEGVSFLAWNEGEYAGFRDAKWSHIQDEKMVPVSLNPMSFDHFINVPILKNHETPATSNQEYTCCLKNFVGILPYDGPGSRTDANIHTADLGEKAAELGLIVPRITMNVVDALIPILTGGPGGLTENMDTAEAGLVLASSDRVACDSVAVAVLKHYGAQAGVDRGYVTRSVWEQAQIAHARELGLGAQDPASIEIADQGVLEIESIRAAWV